MNKTAKEMFEELGYRIIHNDDDYLIYYGFINCVRNNIGFDKSKKEYQHWIDGTFESLEWSNDEKELEAIKKQFSEFGWGKAKREKS